jgi:hypothetical protein
MPSSRASLRKLKVSYVLGFASLFLIPTGILLPNAAGHGSANAQESGPPPQSPEPRPQEPQARKPQAPVSKYDKAIFLKPIPNDQLAFLNQVAGKPSGDAVRDKQFRKLMQTVIPNPMFHYGWDMPLADALDAVLKGSPQPVQIRDGRYVIVSGRSGPYLAGRGFIWIDMHDGVALGGFCFHPTNGEPNAVGHSFFQAGEGKIPRAPSIYRGLEPVVPGIERSARYDTLFHRRHQQKDSAGARRRLLCACGRDDRAL